MICYFGIPDSIHYDVRQLLGEERFNDYFGVDLPEDYGTLIYYDDEHHYHEEKVVSVNGDYGRYYDALYETLINGQEKLVILYIS